MRCVRASLSPRLCCISRHGQRLTAGVNTPSNLVLNARQEPLGPQERGIELGQAGICRSFWPPLPCLASLLLEQEERVGSVGPSCLSLLEIQISVPNCGGEYSHCFWQLSCSFRWQCLTPLHHWLWSSWIGTSDTVAPDELLWSALLWSWVLLGVVMGGFSSCLCFARKQLSPKGWAVPFRWHPAPHTCFPQRKHYFILNWKSWVP